MTILIDNIAHIFLWFTHETFIVPFIILGYIWVDKNNFYHATCLLLLSMLFNYALKITFAIPLNPALGKIGFAFPSGHMQQAVIFFGWLALNVGHKKIHGLTILLLLGIGLSLIHFGYHNYYDILGSIFFGLLSIMGYRFMVSHKTAYTPWVVILIGSIFLIYIYLSKAMTTHLRMAFCTLCGFVTSFRIFDSLEKSNHTGVKLLKTILCGITLILITLFFSLTGVKNLIPTNAQWFVLGFVIPYLNSVTLKFNKGR